MGDAVLVCVTRQKTCKRLIVAGAEIAKEKNGNVHVIHIARAGDNLLGNPSESEALDYLYQVSTENGADMTMIRSNEVVSTIAAQAEKLNAGTIVMGRLPRSKRAAFDIVDEVSARLPNVAVRTVYDED